VHQVEDQRRLSSTCFEQILVHHQQNISVHAAYSMLACIYECLAAKTMWMELVYRNFSSWFKRCWVAAFIIVQHCWLLPFISIDIYLGVRCFLPACFIMPYCCRYSCAFFLWCFCIDMFVLPVGHWQTLHSLKRASWYINVKITNYMHTFSH